MKGLRLTDEQKSRVLALFAAGRTYSEIERATGVSRASITGIVKERAESDPDLTITRQLASWLRAHKIPAEALMRYRTIDEEIQRAGTSLTQLEKVIPLVQRFGPKAVEIAELAEKVQETLVSRGWTPEKLISECSRLERKMEVLQSEIQKSEKLAETINTQIEEKKSKLVHLEALEQINETLTKIGRRPSEVASILTESEKLLSTGLTFQILKAIGEELKSTGTTLQSAATAIATAVKRNGSLKQEELLLGKNIESLKKREEALHAGIAQLEERRRKLRSECAQLAKDEKALRRSFELLTKEHNAREEAHLRAMETLQKQTELRCKEMVEEAKLEARRARENAEEARRNALHWETRAEQKKQEVMAAKLLVSYLVKKDPVRFEQIKALYQAGGAYSMFPLPEDLRSYFNQAVGHILTEDAKARLREVEQEAKRKKEEAEKILKDAFAINQSIERRARLLQGFENARKYAAEDFEAVVQVLTSEPTILGEIIGGLSDASLFNIFLSLPQQERARFKQILHYAEAHAREQEERMFHDWVNWELAKLKADIVTQLTMSGVQVIPQDMVAVAATVNAEVLDEPMIENGKVQYDQFGLPKRRLRIVRQGIK